ncbi:MAG: isopentenyl-diphosphate Delta-isomerase [Gammaproteobacteria bacterium]|nr:isopentenyl-diphosphate Delta-isomerase [Gammaproteobacteria bacterium]
MSVNANRVVSSENEDLIIVDQDDVEIGTLSKARCHDGDGILHRAFSLFIFNVQGELLLQQRSGGKRLWPLFWSNSCCSHPRQGETMDVAIRRRLDEELGIATDLEFVYKFSYQARYGDLGSENELCSVYVGCCDQPIRPNQSEIVDSRFIAADDLQAELMQSGDRFTPWFRMEWEKLSGEFSAQLAKLTNRRSGSTRYPGR